MHVHAVPGGVHLRDAGGFEEAGEDPRERSGVPGPGEAAGREEHAVVGVGLAAQHLGMNAAQIAQALDAYRRGEQTLAYRGAP